MMNKTKIIACFSILMGTSLILTWVVLFFKGDMPDDTPLKLAALLTAEFLTGSSLIIAGYGVLTRRNWGLNLQLVALGTLLYCATYSIGLGDGGKTPLIIFFATVAFLTLLSASYFVHKAPSIKEHGGAN
jgi:peptidoglycan/LPS O-acetylase OafA/YrhL